MRSRSLFDQVVVVLVSTRNPLNIGAAARAMSNFGFSQLRVVNPYELAFREAKSAVGAAALLRGAREFSSVTEAVADCSLVVGTTAARDRKLDHPLRTLQQGAVLVRRKTSRSKIALLFGCEKRGLSNEDFSHCDWLMRIPTQPQQPSMNLGQAVAVCLYEISRAAQSPVLREREPAASSADLERLTALLYDSLIVSGYTKNKNDAAAVRRLVRRLKLSPGDAQLLLGMLRQMLWKMRHA
ncbi:MAG TPA: TrmJ/YjtD family RNA methyltransferase [Terriglobales bacterium]